jgi:hypothetical protein
MSRKNAASTVLAGDTVRVFVQPAEILSISVVRALGNHAMNDSQAS